MAEIAKIGAREDPGEGPRRRYLPLRLTLLTGAFLLILINPVLNYFLQIDFVQGWYQSLGIGRLWFVSPLEGFESLLVTRTVYLPSLIGMLIPVTVALLLGRVFCSWICPITFILEWFERLRLKLAGRRHLRDRLLLARQVLWYTLIAELLLSMIIGAPLFVFLSPPGLVGREIMMAVFFRTLALEGLIVVAVVLLDLLTRRFFCRYFCPLGALLAVLGSRRRLRVARDRATCTACGRCDEACPLGLFPSLGEGDTAYCWNCGNCVDRCRHRSLQFVWLPDIHGLQRSERVPRGDEARSNGSTGPSTEVVADAGERPARTGGRSGSSAPSSHPPAVGG